MVHAASTSPMVLLGLLEERNPGLDTLVASWQGLPEDTHHDADTDPHGEGDRPVSPVSDPLLNGDQLTQATEAELMGLMSAQRAAPGLARDAWAEMYRRHARYVTVVIARAFGDRARYTDVTSDIVTETFRTVFDWAGRQSRGEVLTSRFSAPDPDAVRRKVLGFHAVVAKRLATRRFANEVRRQLEFLPSDEEAISGATVDGAGTTWSSCS